MEFQTNREYYLDQLGLDRWVPRDAQPMQKSAPSANTCYHHLSVLLHQNCMQNPMAKQFMVNWLQYMGFSADQVDSHAFHDNYANEEAIIRVCEEKRENGILVSFIPCATLPQDASKPTDIQKRVINTQGYNILIYNIGDLMTNIMKSVDSKRALFEYSNAIMKWTQRD